MARVVPGPLVSAISGHVGDVAFQRRPDGSVRAIARAQTPTHTSAAALDQKNWFGVSSAWWVRLAPELRVVYGALAAQLGVLDRVVFQRAVIAWARAGSPRGETLAPAFRLKDGEVYDLGVVTDGYAAVVGPVAPPPRLVIDLVSTGNAPPRTGVWGMLFGVSTLGLPFPRLAPVEGDWFFDTKPADVNVEFSFDRPDVLPADLGALALAWYDEPDGGLVVYSPTVNYWLRPA